MHDITDAFLNANANQEFIASTLTSVLRDLMRATAVKHDHVSAVVTAAESWKLLLQLLERCEQPAPWGELFEEAVKRLRDDGRPEGDDVSEALREVARTGMSIYIEGRTGGFSSVKQQAFMVAIDHLEEKRRRRPELSTQKERGVVYPERRKGRLTKNWTAEAQLLGKRVRRSFATLEDAKHWASSIKHV